MSAVRWLKIAISADARIALRFRAGPFDGLSRRRLARAVLWLYVSSDAFLALLCFRTRVAMLEPRIPIALPLLHRASMVIAPFTTIGLVAGEFQGPTTGRGVHVGTTAKVLGPVTVSDCVRIGANAVVLNDFPAGVTAVGVPARVVR